MQANEGESVCAINFTALFGTIHCAFTLFTILRGGSKTAAVVDVVLRQ